MNTFNKARLVKKELNDKLRKKYIDLGHKFLINLMAPVTAFTRHLCVLQGKNPDYVAPPPTPVELPPSIATRNVMAVNYIPVWVKKSFKDKREHIINKIRTAAPKETNSAPLQVVAPNTFFEKAPPRYECY